MKSRSKLHINLTEQAAGEKSGKQKNALNFPYFRLKSNSKSSIVPPPVVSSDPLVTGMPDDKPRNWLVELKDREPKELAPAKPYDHHELVFEKYSPTVNGLLMDIANAAGWRGFAGKGAKLLAKRGEDMGGWGWVVYRVHSSGEAILPENPTPQNYTIFNFWQLTFAPGRKPDLTADIHTWHLYAKDSLFDFERLLPGEVEHWLKEQLYEMSKLGCMWVALPDLLDRAGKKRKPTIHDALHAFSLMSFGRNYDPYQTEAHFYDRPPQHNQFVPGYFKR